MFAIGNYGQRLLKPFHDFLMEVLRKIPMGGTFNQVAPLDRLAGFSKGFSYDLKSATDRWPLQLQVDLVERVLCFQVS